MLAFHGFDRDCNDFKVFATSLGTKYRIISFDLFCHGQTPMPEDDRALTPDDLEDIITKYLEENKINKFSLLGHSVGGKIVLSCIELFGEYVKDVFLFAPYGVRENKWIRRFQNWKPAQWLFKYAVNNPGLFFALIHLLHRVWLITETQHDFLYFQMGTPERRKKMYAIWKLLRLIEPDISEIKRIVNRYAISMNLFYGEFDPIEPRENGFYLVKRMSNKNIRIMEDMGHNLINETTNEVLKEYI